MKFIAKKSEISEPLSISSYFIATGSTIPVLSNILFEVKKDIVNIVSTDLDISAKIKCKVQKIEEEGKFALNKKIVSTIKEFPDADIVFQSDKNDNIKVTCLKSEYKFISFPAEEFTTLQPEDKKLETIKLPQRILLNILNLVSYAALKESSKRNLNGVFIKFEGKNIEVVATDAHRLAFYKTEIKETVKTKFEYIIPLKTVNELIKIIKDDEEKFIEINLYDKVIEFKTENIEIISRIIDENYPNYKQVIPKDFIAKAIINREEMLSAVKRVITITSEKSKVISLKFEKNKLFISTAVQDEGEALEEIDIKYDGDSMEVSYNAIYLIDVLKTVKDDEIEINLVSSMNPGLIKIPGREEFIYIIMPIRK
ncbi:MAG: DNA polymerase III subunit beta [Candidatus Goldbacteria bacterium]|nr:DNA polymerase III subunit beta [Candidatus Goldiibacteriota bacterium]